MGWAVLLVVVVLAAALLSLLTTKKKRKNAFKYDPNQEWPFEKASLLSVPEQVLFQRLKEALPEHHIFAQVQLSRLVRVQKGHDFKAWFNRISRMSADFVVLDKGMNTVAVIELDDSSHQKPDRREADAKKDKALTAAGIQVLRWNVKSTPSKEEIKGLIS